MPRCSWHRPRCRRCRPKYSLVHLHPSQRAGWTRTPGQAGQAALISAQANLMNAHTRERDLGLKAVEGSVENQNRDLDRESEERISLLQLAKEVVVHPEGKAMITDMVAPSEEAMNSGER